MDIIEKLNWRYATKKFDPNKKMSGKDFEELLEVLRLSPSSYGLQPWKFIVVKNPEIRKQLRDAAWDQPQITDASHLIVLCHRTDIDETYINNFVELAARLRNQNAEKKANHSQMLKEWLSGETNESLERWAANQVYIALGVLLTACAIKNIDSCPMGGFKKDEFDEILGLDKLNLKSEVLCAIGYRGEDEAAKNNKVRFDKQDITLEI